MRPPPRRRSAGRSPRAGPRARARRAPKSACAARDQAARARPQTIPSTLTTSTFASRRGCGRRRRRASVYSSRRPRAPPGRRRRRRRRRRRARSCAPRRARAHDVDVRASVAPRTRSATRCPPAAAASTVGRARVQPDGRARVGVVVAARPPPPPPPPPSSRARLEPIISRGPSRGCAARRARRGARRRGRRGRAARSVSRRPPPPTQSPTRQRRAARARPRAGGSTPCPRRARRVERRVARVRVGRVARHEQQPPRRRRQPRRRRGVGEPPRCASRSCASAAMHSMAQRAGAHVTRGHREWRECSRGGRREITAAVS